MHRRFAGLAGILALIGVSMAPANLVLYDGFDYTLGAALSGQQSAGSG